MSQNKTILITGATGYIGRRLLEKLIRTPNSVRIFVRDSGKVPHHLLSLKNLQVVTGDLNNMNALREAVCGADVIFHLAAASTMFERKGRITITNVIGTENLLNACKFAGGVRIIFSSSTEAVGPSSKGLITLKDKPQPITDYGFSKLICENKIIKFCENYPHVMYTIVRIGNVYDGGGFIKMLLEVLRKKNWQTSILLHLLKDYSLHLIHLEDLTEMLVKLIDCKKCVNKIYYFANESLSIEQICHILMQKYNLEVMPKPLLFESSVLYLQNYLAKMRRLDNILTYISIGGRDRRYRNYDINEAINDLNYTPKIKLKDI